MEEDGSHCSLLGLMDLTDIGASRAIADTIYLWSLALRPYQGSREIGAIADTRYPVSTPFFFSRPPDPLLVARRWLNPSTPTSHANPSVCEC